MGKSTARKDLPLEFPVQNETDVMCHAHPWPNLLNGGACNSDGIGRLEFFYASFFKEIGTIRKEARISRQPMDRRNMLECSLNSSREVMAARGILRLFIIASFTGVTRRAP